MYYRKDGESSFSIGVRQPDREVGAKPWGITDAVWNRRVGEARGHLNNFALYNAPPEHGAAHAGVLLPEPVGQPDHAAGGDGVHARRCVQADARLQSAGEPFPFPFQRAAHRRRAPSTRSRPGCRCFATSASTSRYSPTSTRDSHPNDTGKVRLDEQKVYFQGCERFSDRDFLLIPGEEPDREFRRPLHVPVPAAACSSLMRRKPRRTSSRSTEDLPELRQGLPHRQRRRMSLTC